MPGADAYRRCVNEELCRIERQSPWPHKAQRWRRLAWLQDILDILIPTIINFLAGIASTIWNFLATLVFWIWDELNLPNVLSWIEFALDYLSEFITWALATAQDIVTFFTDLSWLILVGWWVWAVPIQWGRAKFNPLGGLANFIDAYFNDIIPVDIVGIHIVIPQGIVFTLWLMAILPADFAIFTAMNS